MEGAIVYFFDFFSGLALKVGAVYNVGMEKRRKRR